MHLTRLAVVAALAVSSLPAEARAANGDDVPPVLVDGARVVDIADSAGGISRYTTIPWSSEFRTHGGRGARCTFASTYSGTTSDGQTYEAGQRVESERWLFVEGTLPSFGEAPPDEPLVDRGPLAGAVRHFAVFCDSVQHFLGLLDVSSRDPMIDPRQRVSDLYNGLRLERPVLWPDPVVEKWGGFVTRFPTWLAVRPSAWRTQRSNLATWRGWSMYLEVVPVVLGFRIAFVPDRRRPSPAFDGVVPCVERGEAAVADAVALPAVPDLVADPPSGEVADCTWVPPGPGTVVVEPRITYVVRFWANGYTEALDDYVWSGLAVTVPTGDLRAVNTPG